MNTGAVSTATKEATEVGNKILASGGNAFDAVVASAIALTVTEPGNSGLGGEGYCTFYDARTGETGSLCFMGVPGELAVPENVAGEDLIRGVMASLIPGAVAGWFALIAEKCSKSAEELIEPSIRLAEEGFVIGDMAGGFNWMADQFHPSAHNIFIRTDRPWQVDDRLHQPELADTLRMLAKHGNETFYKGEFADKLDRFYRETGGILRKTDLARYKPLWQKTMSRWFGDVEVHVPPPESTGFAMLYALELLKRAGYDSVPSGGVDAVRMLALVLTKMDECADEIAGRLLPYDPEVEESIAGLFEEDALTDAAERLFGETTPCCSRMGTHTTSLSACDSSGNLVCLTQTLDHGFGSGVVIPGTGVVMNNGMAWLNTDRDTRRADKLVPYQHYFAPVVPTVALTSSGQPLYAIGTPGGNGIPQTTLQVYANILFHKDDIQSAIDKPRIIVGAVIPEGGRNHKINLESGFAPEVRRKFQPAEDDGSYHYYGNFHAVQINPDGSFTTAADSNPRLS